MTHTSNSLVELCGFFARVVTEAISHRQFKHFLDATLPNFRFMICNDTVKQYSANNCYALRSKIRCTQNKVTTKITKNTTTSKKITTSKANKTYHVRIRTYKVAGGKTYYSAWSAAKAVKTK